MSFLVSLCLSLWAAPLANQGDSTAIPSPVAVQATSPTATMTGETHSNAFWRGTGYGTGGMFLGALAGGSVAALLTPDNNTNHQIISDKAYSAILGAMIGATVGCIGGAAYGVKASRLTDPDRSMGGPILGGSTGFILGVLLLGGTAKDLGLASLVFPPLLTSAGAVLADFPVVRSATAVSVAPWSPSPGLWGARMEIALGK